MLLRSTVKRNKVKKWSIEWKRKWKVWFKVYGLREMMLRSEVSNENENENYGLKYMV